MFFIRFYAVYHVCLFFGGSRDAVFQGPYGMPLQYDPSKPWFRQASCQGAGAKQAKRDTGAECLAAKER